MLAARSGQHALGRSSGRRRHGRNQAGHGISRARSTVPSSARFSTSIERGILLAVCSKNNPRRSHGRACRIIRECCCVPSISRPFVSIGRIRPQNLREIAAELNLGIDSIAFFDDNPVERELVRSEVPEVKVIAVPDHVQGYAQALRDFPYFERLTLSAEDQEKTQAVSRAAQTFGTRSRTLVLSKISSGRSSRKS